MNRHHLKSDGLIDLGAATTETQGIGVPLEDTEGQRSPPGLADD